MSAPFIGEIAIMPYTYAPLGWAWCDGQEIAVSQNPALSSIIGTQYGGYGNTLFNLPNLGGRAPLGCNQAPGLSNYQIGQQGGSDTVTLTADQLPSHTHEAFASRGLGTSGIPNTQSSVGSYRYNRAYYRTPEASMLTAMSNSALASAGNGTPHENRQPYLVLNFCIALEGEYPFRG